MFNLFSKLYVGDNEENRTSKAIENSKTIEESINSETRSPKKSYSKDDINLAKDTEPLILVQKMNPSAITPSKSTKLSAGWDICSIDNHIIEPQSQVLVETGIALRCPIGTYCRISPRSSLCFKNQITVMAGVVDRDYQDTIKVILYNYGKQEYKVKQGDRIAQLIFEKIASEATIKTVESLPHTERGFEGFGSTEKKLEWTTTMIDKKILKILPTYNWLETNENIIKCTNGKEMICVRYPKTKRSDFENLVKTL